MKFAAYIFSALTLALTTSQSFSQTADAYPAKPVKIVVGFGAGGPADSIARLFGQKLSESLKQSFIVENIPGASGNIAAARVAKAPADGYTLHVVSTGFIVNPSLYARNVGYDPQKDFEPISMLAVSPNVITVNNNVAAGNILELVEKMRKNPTAFSYAHTGVGSTPHLNGELFKLAYKLDSLTAVAFNGPQLLLSVVSGDTPVAFTSLPSALPFINEGKMRPVVVLSKTRSERLPNVPNTVEAGIEGMEGDTVVGILAPAGTPRAIVDLLNAEIRKAAAMPDLREKLGAIGFGLVASTPIEFKDRISSEIAHWKRVITQTKIVIE